MSSSSVIPLNQFSSYTSAIRRGDRIDDYRRDFAFLGLSETLNIAGTTPRSGEGAPTTGFRLEINQLTLQMFIELCAVKSPFLVGGRIGPEHVAQILWRLSPQYDLRAGTQASVFPPSRSAFVASIAGLPFRATARAISRYLDRMFVDKPPQSVKGGGTRPDTSLAASLVHELASAYGWSDEQILATPMPRLFQYLRKIQRANNSDLLYHNPTRDKLKGRAFNKIRAKMKLDGAAEPIAVGSAVSAEEPTKAEDSARCNLDVTGTDGCKATIETTQRDSAQ